MISYVTGNLFESHAEALVNTVNTVGVMGKGIALQFREAFPENYRIYKETCRKNQLHVGEMLIVEDSNLISGRRLIVNFPTKTHWKLPSEYSYIHDGLTALRKEIIKRRIKSIAIPPLGSHNGGLDWLRVKPMIAEALSDLNCEVIVYEPSDVIIEKMKSERVRLTPGRALLLAMFSEMIANSEFASVFAAEKLVYFMQRMGASEYFRIDFKPYYYGPYSGGKVAHVLYHLNGSYIKGMGGLDNRPFDYIWLLDGTAQDAFAYIDGYKDGSLRAIYEKTRKFLRGYYSNYSLEMLSSVDYLLQNCSALKDWRNICMDSVLDTLQKELGVWSKRKEQIFSRDLLADTVAYLRQN